MGIELVMGISAMKFDMTFAKFLGFWEKQFKFNSNINKEKSNNNLNLKFEFQTLLYNKSV
jgi:hypothetical protein